MTSKEATTPLRHAPEQPVRPTEAQLRWAQFHRKSRVASVKETVDRLWQTPASVSDVEGAFPDDGITSDESSAGASEAASPPKQRPRQRRRRRREKPKISRGRRALLRVSKRAYEQRRTYIQANGYQCCGEDSDDKENCDVDDDEEAEAAVFAMLSEEPRKKHRKRKKMRRSHGLQQVEDEERLRRFEAAYQVIFASLAGPQQHPLEKTPSKRWSRGSHVPVAVSIDGRKYDDLKWGFTGRKESVRRVIASPTNAPADRRASWLVHLPTRPQSERRRSTPAELALLGTDYALSSEVPLPPRMPASPGKAKFDELVARLQSKPAANAGLPLTQSCFEKDTEETMLNGAAMNSASSIQRLPHSKREPFLEKQPHESQEEFEMRRIAPRVPSNKRELPAFLQKFRTDSTSQDDCIVRRNVKRLTPTKRDGFFRALQAPYMSAAAASPVRRRSKSRKTVRRGKRLSTEKHDPFLQSNELSRGKYSARRNVKKLSREKRGAFLKVPPDETPVGDSSGMDLESSFRTVGSKVGGLLGMFSSSKKGTGEEEKEALGNPMASLRDFFSGGKKVTQDEVSAVPVEMNDEAAVQAFRKLAAGQELTKMESVHAGVAQRKMVSCKNMTIEQEEAYRKLVFGDELSAEEEDQAAVAYRKVVSRKQLTAMEEDAYRKLVAGEGLTKEEEHRAVEAYRKLVYSEEADVDDEDVEDFFGALRKLASGQEMTVSEDIQALDAWHRMISSKLMTIEEESSYRKLVFGDELTREEEDEAAAAYGKVISHKQLTSKEEVAYRKLVTGEELTKVEERQAIEVYRRLISFDEDMNEEDEGDLEDFFGALRKLAAGQEMTASEEIQAQSAYQRMVACKGMTIEEESAYRNLVSGVDLTAEEEDLAVLAYSKLVSGRHLTDAEEQAYGALISGEELSNKEESQAMVAYQKLISVEVTGEESVEDLFGALQKLAACQEMTAVEEVRAAAAYQQMVSRKQMTNEEDAAFKRLVAGVELSVEEEDQAVFAYSKLVSGRHLTDAEETAYGKFVTGEELTDEEEHQAVEAFRKLVSSEEADDGDTDVADFFDALRKLASSQEMTDSEDIEALDTWHRMVSSKLMTIEEESSYRKLVFGDELTKEEEVQAAGAYLKIASRKQMSGQENAACRKLVAGQALTKEEEHQVVSSYRKVVSCTEVTEEEDEDDFFGALRKVAAGQELSPGEETQAVEAYRRLVSSEEAYEGDEDGEDFFGALRKLASSQEMTPDSEDIAALDTWHRMVSSKLMTIEEESSYRKLVFGDELTKEEEVQAAGAFLKIASRKQMSGQENAACRKLVAGQALTIEEEHQAVNAYRKVVSCTEDIDDEDEDDFFGALRKVAAGQELTPGEETQALDAYQKMVAGKLMTFATDEEELQTVAAFRRMHDERKDANHDNTSVSSVQLLPDGTPRVVRGLSGQENVHETESQAAESEYTQQSSRFSVHSPDRSGPGRSGDDVLSPEKMKSFHQHVLETSALIGEGETDQTIIDTDDTTSDASGIKMNPKMAAGLLLSPTILTKRHQQAIRAVEQRNWEQASYLLSANPWLAEMPDLTTRQFLLHKVALYGASIEVDPQASEVRHVGVPAAPEPFNMDIIRMFPSAVHKFDQDGNLPLHMAAASGNLAMIKLLSERFPSGASVRNDDGLLPLHLAILTRSPHAAGSEQTSIPTEAIKIILKLFPGAVAVADNEGNLPLHTAAGALQGDVGVDIIHMLLDEAERQANSTSGVRFSDIKMKEDDDSVSVITAETATPTDMETVDGDTVRCTTVRNNHGHNPLVKAIRSKAGWEIVEAIVGGPGGVQAALRPDVNMNNALHLLVSGEFAEPASILSILKFAPRAASIRNGEGMLPIEVACMQLLPREVILALVLVDLPVDLDAKEGVKVLEGFGSSWWYVTCECDDHNVEVVEEVISICSYAQIRELCFMQGGPNHSAGPVLSRATPKCRLALRKALRFVGRFEFLGSSALHTDSSIGLKVFEALDFGTEEEPLEEGRRTLLYCYGSENSYMDETTLLRQHEFDSTYVEEAFDFAVHELDNQSAHGAARQFCVAIERPNLTLDRVVAGISKNVDYHRDSDMRNRFLSKVSMVLRLIAKAIRYLHIEGVVHSCICLQNCGKFDDRWKLTGLMEMHNTGDSFDPSSMGESSPPETVERNASFGSQAVADPSIDIWAFGKLAYEVLVGEPLIDFDSDNALFSLAQWNEANLREVVENLERSGISSTGADLIAHCLMPKPEHRPANMDDILDHPFWKEMRRKGTSKSRSKHHRSHRIDN